MRQRYTRAFFCRQVRRNEIRFDCRRHLAGCERGSIRIGSISKLTDIELVMNDGTSRIICGDTPKDELMGNEARAFYELITEPENNREKYRELRETALSVSRTMQRIRESAGIKFDGGIA